MPQEGGGVQMKILIDSSSIHLLEHVRLGIDIDGNRVTIIAMEEDSKTNKLTLIGCAQFDAKNSI